MGGGGGGGGGVVIIRFICETRQNKTKQVSCERENSIFLYK
jgi:hypothetical protein